MNSPDSRSFESLGADHQGHADVISLHAGTAAAVDRHAIGATLSALVELTKPRITRLVTITSSVGFVMAAAKLRPWFTLDLVLAATGCLLGTAMSAAGANAMNQWMERRRDALMARTAHRPLPGQRLSPSLAAWVSVGLCITGVAVLLLLAGPAPALVSAVTIVLYLLAYTPLKPVTPLSTVIGAVPGALPPLIGWSAAAGHSADGPLTSLLQAGGWSLFVLMFVWQIPHFLAIAWMYRQDYAKGGFRMLPLLDPSGRLTAAMVLAWSVALLPAALAPAFVMSDRLGLIYAVVALVSGVLYLAAAVRLVARRTTPNAKTVFLASIIHLPLLLVAMVADVLITAI